MIPLNRSRSTAAVNSNFRGTRRLELSLELMEDRRKLLKGETDTQKFKSSVWKNAKSQLLKETHNKCAYCEAPTAVVAYGDVEHYRPKSTYWWLAYCYDNYLPSCQLCNQKYKKAKFQTLNPKMESPVNVTATSTDAFLSSKEDDLFPDALNTQAVADFEKDHLQEWALIVNPYVDDPAIWFAWEADDTLEEVKLIPTSAPNAADVVKAAEDDLGLNRKELRVLRYAEYDKFRTFKLVLNEPAISTATRNRVRDTIEKMLEPKAAFAGMLLYFDALL